MVKPLKEQRCCVVIKAKMEEHYKTLSAVFPIILRSEKNQQQVLLHQRANTGYMDGMWDFAGSGHVEEGETAKQALIRECKEELAIVIASKDIAFAHLSHRVGQNGARSYYDIYFTVHSFHGKPKIAEPNKCSALQWFAIDDLPANMIASRRLALKDFLQYNYYRETLSPT